MYYVFEWSFTLRLATKTMEKRPLQTLQFQIFSWHAGAYWLGTNMCNTKCLGNYNCYEPTYANTRRRWGLEF